MCSACRKIHSEKGRHPPCEACRHNPQIEPGNVGALWFINHVYPILSNGFGGIDGGALETAFNVYGVPKHERPALLDKLIIYLGEIHRARKKTQEIEDGRGQSSHKGSGRRPGKSGL